MTGRGSTGVSKQALDTAAAASSRRRCFEASGGAGWPPAPTGGGGSGGIEEPHLLEAYLKPHLTLCVNVGGGRGVSMHRTFRIASRNGLFLLIIGTWQQQISRLQKLIDSGDAHVTRFLWGHPAARVHAGGVKHMPKLQCATSIDRTRCQADGRLSFREVLNLADRRNQARGCSIENYCIEILRKASHWLYGIGVGVTIRAQQEVSCCFINDGLIHKHGYTGRSCVPLEGLVKSQELIALLRNLILCMFFPKKPYEVFLEFGGYGQSDILIRKSKARVMKPSFTVVRDKSTKSFILFIRGSTSVKDRLTTATAAEVPFHHVVLKECCVSNVVVGHVHCGMVAATRWIADQAIPCLSRAVEQFPDYRIKVHGELAAVDPAAPIKEIRCCAWRTKIGCPWEIVLCIYDFPQHRRSPSCSSRPILSSWAT
uniref:Fungal lipase-type domain-containing protein n=1 Tax=Oryza meridionalis TaxID=40149 RepID=A0A0E0DPA8_9ORYZ